ncbi:MAG: hypothetical protein U0667_17205 [Chloroflexota bacterium]
MSGEPQNGTPVTWRDLGNLGVVRRLDDHEVRINAVESVIDQLKGAKALIYFLIGSNLLAVLAVAWGVFK